MKMLTTAYSNNYNYSRSMTMEIRQWPKVQAQEPDCYLFLDALCLSFLN